MCGSVLWMHDLRFYVLFNSISVISGRWVDDYERLSPRAVLEPGTAKSVSQRSTHSATGAPVWISKQLSEDPSVRH